MLLLHRFSRDVCADAVLVTGIMAFTAAQQAIGALNYMPELTANTPMKSLLADPAMCLTGRYVDATLKDIYLRQMKCAPRQSVFVLRWCSFPWQPQECRVTYE